MKLSTFETRKLRGPNRPAAWRNIPILASPNLEQKANFCYRQDCSQRENDTGVIGAHIALKALAFEQDSYPADPPA
jgi:hypothetical protein